MDGIKPSILQELKTWLNKLIHIDVIRIELEISHAVFDCLVFINSGKFVLG